MVWKMASKTDWLHEGCIILAEQGVQALTIDLLCQRLSLTKGSFYHHFKGFNGYKADLLAYFVQKGTLNIIEITEQGQSAQEKLQRLLKATTEYPANLEIAVRGWALQDADVAQVQARVDEQRVTYLQALFTELGEAPDRAHRLGQMLYTIFIGCQQIQPTINEGGMTALYHEFLGLYGGIA